MKPQILLAAMVAVVCASAQAQVNSGSTGSDGTLDFSNINYTTNIVINMADHPNGIYQYTYVNIPSGVTVSFIPNANNSPVVWLVQSNCTIAGTLSVNGMAITNNPPLGAIGGPGGWAGGNGALSYGMFPSSGFGLGGGKVGACVTNWDGGNASYASPGDCNTNFLASSGDYPSPQYLPGDVYGNTYELPLLGGSGGSGDPYGSGGGGGGGAILIAVSGTLNISGSITARGGNGYWPHYDWSSGNTYLNGNGGAGSGGAIRLIASTISGSGSLDTSGGSSVYGIRYYTWSFGYDTDNAGCGRIRLESLSDTFNGSTTGTTTRGYTGIIFLPKNQLPQLTVTSVGGIPVSASPTGVLSTPDAVLSAQQNNPIPVIVSCANLPLNTSITVTVKPATGAAVSATGFNSTGTLASSIATISIVIPRGGGFIYATAVTGN